MFIYLQVHSTTGYQGQQVNIGFGVRVTNAPFVNFSVSKIFDPAREPVRFIASHITFIFDICHRSLVAATPVKYERDIQQLTCILEMLKH